MAKSWGNSWRGSWNASWGSASNTCDTAWGTSWADSWRCAWELRQQRTGGHWDTSDPLFYDWWRKRAQEERQKLEVVETIAQTVSDPPLREEIIAAIEVASSIDEIRSLDLLTHELNALKAAIADYQQFLDEDEEEAAILLLMH